MDILALCWFYWLSHIHLAIVPFTPLDRFMWGIIKRTFSVHNTACDCFFHLEGSCDYVCQLRKSGLRSSAPSINMMTWVLSHPLQHFHSYVVIYLLLHRFSHEGCETDGDGFDWVMFFFPLWEWRLALHQMLGIYPSPLHRVIWTVERYS